MAKFFEQVKNLMNDVEEFLGQVKESKLPSSAKTLKVSITQQIQQLREDRPQLDSSAITTTTPQPAADNINDDDGLDLYEDADNYKDLIASHDLDTLKKELTASDSSNLTIQCQLRLRKDKNFLGKKVKSKQWCVLRNRVFYIYEKKNSKKQTECFFVDGYQVTPMEKEGAKKDVAFPFEMICDNKKTYVFEAVTIDDQTSWVNELHKATGIGARNRPVTLTEPNPDYPDDEDLYEDTEAFIPTAPLAVDTPPLTPRKQFENGRPLDSPGGSISQSSAQHSTTPSGDSFPEDLYDATGPEEEELYDQTDVTDESQTNIPPPPDKALPPLPVAAPSLPPRTERNSPPPLPSKTNTPPPVKTNTPPPPTTNAEIYDDMYYGVWDCEGNTDRELSFQRGDVITVVSREFGNRGWWVGKLDEKIGLVPKEYLTEAYERTS